jgi:hypothetical protein
LSPPSSKGWIAILSFLPLQTYSCAAYRHQDDHTSLLCTGQGLQREEPRNQASHMGMGNRRSSGAVKWCRRLRPAAATHHRTRRCCRNAEPPPRNPSKRVLSSRSTLQRAPKLLPRFLTRITPHGRRLSSDISLPHCVAAVLPLAPAFRSFEDFPSSSFNILWLGATNHTASHAS